MDFNLDRLRTFIVVSRTGNLSTAARELGATQPNLGRQMTALEKEVGFTLFVRHSRGIGLTEQGQEYFELCKDFVGQIEQKTNIIKEKGPEVRGTLKILVGVGAGQIILDNLTPFAIKFPNLCFKISSITDIFQFKIGDSDAGIIPTRSSDPDLIQHHLYDMDLRIYASPSYLENHTWPKHLEDLQYHNMIVYSGDTLEITRSLKLHLTGDAANDLKYKNYIDVDNGLALRKALINGLGIGSFWYDADLLNQNLLVDVFPDMPSRRIPHYFTYHRRLEGSPKIHAFHEFLKEIVKPFQLMIVPEKN
jgi:DNA-binding transcriptional LysR family regulator